MVATIMMAIIVTAMSKITAATIPPVMAAELLVLETVMLLLLPSLAGTTGSVTGITIILSRCLSSCFHG